MYFDESDDYYVMIENHGDVSIYKLTRNYEWKPESIEGEDLYLGTLFSNYDIDEVMDSLRKVYSVVELIDESEIDDYI